MPVVRADTRPARLLSDRLHGRHRFVTGAVFVLLAVLAAVAHQWLLRFDGPVSEWVRDDRLTGLFQVVTSVGDTEVAIGTAVLLALVAWRRCRTFALLYPGTLIVGSLVNISLKALIGRPRPPAPNTSVALASFPSGHTLQATLFFGLLPVAVYLMVGRQWAFRATAVVSVLGIIGVGVSRVYLGAHWPTDVIGGVILGAGLILATEWVLSRPDSHRVCCCVLAQPA